MLDKTSKQILEYLYNCSDYTFHANHGYPEQFTQADFLAACLLYTSDAADEL